MKNSEEPTLTRTYWELFRFDASSCRFLYTKEALGLTGYEATRERTATQLGSMKERFKTRMDQYLSGDSKSLIFTEDLKNMLYLTENEKDIQMVEKMMSKFAKQNQELRFGTFIFGPVVMRMFYHLNKPDLALKALQNPDLATFFDQLTSFQILMDLLYEHKRYDDVLKVFDLLRQRPFTTGRFPKDTLVLAIGACYKLGTPEAYEKAKELMKAASDSQAPIMRKAVTFCAALALKNNDAAGALETLSIPQNQAYVTIRNLKALALIQLDRLEDLLPIFRSAVEQDTAYQARPMPNFFSDVYNQVKAAVLKKGDKEISAEFEKIFTKLESNSGIESQTLAEFLDRPIEDVPRHFPGEFGNRPGSRFGGSSYQGGGMREPRYPQDDQQSGGYQRQPRYPPSQSDQQGGGFQQRQRYVPQSQSGGSQGEQGGRRGGFYEDRNQDRSRGPGSYSQGRRDRDEGGYNANAEAGYKPRTGYQRYPGNTRQGLQESDD